jgi:hypothetical protein
MTREEFLHELKGIITIQKTLKFNRERLIEIEDRLILKTNELLDIATENYDGSNPTMDSNP